MIGSENFWRRVGILVLTLLLTVGLYLLASRNSTYLLFHSIIELISIVVGVAIFSIGWSTRRLARHSFLLIIAVAILFVGIIDLLHTLSYKGMMIFPWNDVNIPTQFWVAARYLESFSLLAGVVVLIHRRNVSPERLFLLYIIITTVLIVSIVPPGFFPTSFIEPSGITPFKKISEYIIAGIFCLSGILFWQHRDLMDRRVGNLLLLVIGLRITSEIIFALYGGNITGSLTIIGHILKGYAAIALYFALVQASVTSPLQTLFRDVQHSHDVLAEELATRKEIESTLEENREWLRITLTSIGDAVIACDMNGRITFLNHMAASLTGWSIGEALGQPLHDVLCIYHTISSTPADEILTQVLHEGVVVNLADNTVLRSKDLREIVIEANLAPITNGIKEISGGVLVFHDITLRQQAEEALRRYELLANNSRDIVLFLQREDGRLLEANAAALAAYGYSHEELLNLTICNLGAPCIEIEISRQICMADAYGILIESIHQRKDGSTFPVEVSARGASIGGKHTIISIVRDISERKAVEDALQVTEERYRGVVELSPDAIYVLRDTHIIFVNSTALRLLRAKNIEQLLGKSYYDLLHPDYHILVRERFELLLKGNAMPVIEEKIVRLDGSICDVEASSAAYIDQEGFAIQVIMRDITKRKLAEEELRYLSYHDKLTDIYNRRYFQEELSRLQFGRQFR